MRKSVPAAAVFLAAAAVSYSIVSSGANAADALNPWPWSQLVTSDLRLAMMDDMMEMKGGMGGMPPDGSMPNAGSTSGMQDPMAVPSNSDTMGRMRGPMQRRPGMSSMAPASRLPGFPGASHLYHVGATGFFLDHPQHITLSIEQQIALNRIKERALLDRSSSDRRIEEGEQELWMLTAADMPDAARIEAQVRAIEKLRGDQRLAFIRAVGEAGKVLTAGQRAALLGTNPPAGSRPSGTGKPAPMAPMPRM
jgi:Spy/CpxP family protein refolding chaperone